MADLVVLMLLAVFAGAAVISLLKEKKKGTKCLGCSFASTCQKKSSGSNCHTDKS